MFVLIVLNYRLGEVERPTEKGGLFTGATRKIDYVIVHQFFGIFLPPRRFALTQICTRASAQLEI